MEYKKFIRNKNILITGGTGSFGNQIVKRLLEFDAGRIVIFSRDEKKQYDMKCRFEDQSKILEYIIGDIRDYEKIEESMKDIDIVYNAAALKQVPGCESNPYEAVMTNIIGAENVRRAAIKNDIDVVISISTDKAVKPINVMGMTKAIQERLILNSSNGKWSTKFLCVRYGNVIGSRGSVIPFFKQRIANGKFLPITDSKMTRFLLSLNDAINLVFDATIDGESGKLFVKKMPSCFIIDLARVMAEALSGKDDYPIRITGVRPGEKINETLVSEEEMRRCVETKNHYIIYREGYLEKPKLIHNLTEYSSSNTTILREEQIEDLLRSEGFIQ